MINETGEVNTSEADEDVWAEMQEYAEAVDEVQSAFADLLELHKILLSDSVALGQMLKIHGGSLSLRRLIVKNEMAYCEGILWVMKQMALRSRAEFVPPLTDAEKALLEDKQYRLHDTGEVRDEKAKITLKQNVRFAEKILARMKGCAEFSIDFNSDGSRAFFKAVEVRDRLTHPKRPEEMEVTTEEMIAVLEGTQWFNNNFIAFETIRKKATKEDLNATTTAKIVDYRKRGATEEQIATFIQRVHSSYEPPSTGGDGLPTT
ncbi:MAG: hypothetical protein H7145_14630 [Akkermansiaceae bacterium]|nr:hypothetical protein [Armatimonadota bacterium]